MPRVFRQSYSAPIPADARHTTMKVRRRGKDQEVPAVRFKGPDGRQTTAPLTKKGDRVLLKSPYYYGKVNGKLVRLSTDKAASETMLGERIRKEARRKAGLEPGENVARHRARPLDENMDDWRRAILGEGGSVLYADKQRSMAGRIAQLAGWSSIADIEAQDVRDALDELRKPLHATVEIDPAHELYTRGEMASILGITPTSVTDLLTKLKLSRLGQGGGPSRRYPREALDGLLAARPQTRGVRTLYLYLAAIKNFTAWLKEDTRLAFDPLSGLKGANSDVDVRHARRELTPEELRRLLAATRARPGCIRGLSGEQRHALYALACGTGFRASGLASLRPECFNLDATPPTVTLPVRADKSRRGKVQPLPADVTDLMRAFLLGKPTGRHLWPGNWPDKGAEMLRRDLEAAGIPYIVQGPDGPLHADFHALRHSYITALGRAGVDLRTVQELAGHSKITTTERYSHRRDDDLNGAVGKLPAFVSPTPVVPVPCPPLVQTAAKGREESRTPGNDTTDGADAAPRRNALPDNKIESVREGLGTSGTETDRQGRQSAGEVSCLPPGVFRWAPHSLWCSGRDFPSEGFGPPGCPSGARAALSCWAVWLV